MYHELALIGKLNGNSSIFSNFLINLEKLSNRFSILVLFSLPNKMWQILDNLYLGDMRSCQKVHRDYVKDMDVIVNCAQHLPCLHKDKEYYHIEVIDLDDEKENDLMFSHFIHVCTFIHRHIKNGKNVLVHCSMGIQRSPAVIAAYLMKYNNMTKAQAMDFVKTKRPEAFFCGSNFEGALTLWEFELNKS